MIKNKLRYVVGSSALFVSLFSCDSAINEPSAEVSIEPSEVQESFSVIDYAEFSPDTSFFAATSEIAVDDAYLLDSLSIVAGYYQGPSEDGEFYAGDTIGDWGDRLFVFNSQQDLIYKSKGVGDYYLFEPHFYRNKVNDKTVIICQLGFEYLAGGEVFLFENGEMKYIGFLDVSGDDMETGVVDIVKIEENENELKFTFDSDSILMNPATGSPEFVEKSEVSYIFKNDAFQAQ